MKRNSEYPKAAYGNRNKYVVNIVTGCWEWIGALASNGGGYGYLKVNGRVVRAHRFFWEESYGEVPAGMVLHHKCNNSRCVNVDHLELTTQMQNMIYAGVLKLSEEDIRSAFNRWCAGETQKSIAKELGVHYTALSHAFSARGWRRVQL